MSSTTLEAIEGMERHSKSPSVQQWNAETERLRQIERLTECIVYQYEVNDLSMDRSCLDVFCSEDCFDRGNEDGHEFNLGTARDLAIKIHLKGWHIEDYKRFWILCPKCQDKDGGLL